MTLEAGRWYRGIWLSFRVLGSSFTVFSSVGRNSFIHSPNQNTTPPYIKYSQLSAYQNILEIESKGGWDGLMPAGEGYCCSREVGSPAVPRYIAQGFPPYEVLFKTGSKVCRFEVETITV